MVTSPVQPLHDSLQAELSLVERFLVALQAEAQALAQPDQDTALTASTHEKQLCLELLQQAGQAREAALVQLGHTPDHDGLRAATQSPPTLRALADTLLQRAALARELNQANGRLIEAHLQHVHNSLNTLHGLHQGSALYDASGRARSLSPQGTRITAG